MGKDILFPLRRLHGLIVEKKVYRKKKRNYRAFFAEKRKQNPRTVCLALTPEHTNLGDHAIASETVRLLQQLGIDYIEITDEQLFAMRSQKLLDIMNGTPILINGGGNLGTLWFGVEQTMREIVQCNKKSPIVIMPNTIFYEDSEWGKEEFQKSVKLYNRHKKLTICAREKNSYDVMANSYRNVKLIPDLVLFRNEVTEETVRKGCLLCLRNDLEKTVSDKETVALETQLRELFGEAIAYTDTHAKNMVPITQRETELSEKFAEFRGAELVITDRLHGMIFCAITGTPCVVIDSKSPKIRGCYDWLKDLPYIRFADSVLEVTREYNQIPKTKHSYDNAYLQEYYEQLKQVLLSIV